MKTARLPWLQLVGTTPRSWGNVLADVEALPAHARDVLVGGGEPTGSPELLTALETLRERGRRAILVTDGAALAAAARLQAVAKAGAAELALLLDPAAPATAARCAALCHRLGSPAASFAIALTPGLDAAPVVAEAARAGVPLRVLRHLGPTPGPTPRLDDARAAALDRLWRAAVAAGVTLLPDDLARAPDPTAVPDAPVDAGPGFLELVGRGVIPEAATAGVRALPHPELLPEGHTLAALGAPAVDLPPCLGGVGPAGATRRAPGCAPCRASCAGLPAALDDALAAPPPTWSPPMGRRVAIVVPRVDDDVLVVSTLPALAHALSARGADVALLHPYDLTWDPSVLAPPRTFPRWQRWGWLVWRALTRRPTPLDHYTPPDDRLGHPFWWREPPERAAAIEDRFFASLDLTDRDLVLVPGYRAAERVLRNRSLRPDARVVIADLHMLEGVDALVQRFNPLGARPSEGRWWPGERVIVHACFPRYARLYRARGVPLRQVHWRPYPLHLGHFGSAHPVAEGAASFCGGRNFRDFTTLHAAAAGLHGIHPIEVYAEEEDGPGAVGPLRPMGTAPLPDFVAALQRSRFAVLPLRHDVDTAAGLTVVAMALAAGRPVLTSTTGGTLDHVRHEVDGLLVPPGDQGALAHAIVRLETEPDLLERLAAGAQRAARRLSVEAWADELLGAAEPVAARRAGPGGWVSW